MVTMTQFFVVSIFAVFRKNGAKEDRLNIFRRDLRRTSSNALVYRMYQNEDNLQHTFEHCRSRPTGRAS